MPKTRWLTWQGETHTLSEWSREIEIDVRTLHSRVSRGLSIERVMCTVTLTRSAAGRIGARGSRWRR